MIPSVSKPSEVDATARVLGYATPRFAIGMSMLLPLRREVIDAGSLLAEVLLSGALEGTRFGRQSISTLVPSGFSSRAGAIWLLRGLR